MPQSDACTPPPAKSMDDIDKVVDFIRARVRPLRDSASPNSDQERALQALLDLLIMLRVSAQEGIKRGDDPSMQHFYLVTSARQWRGHPDFLPEWRLP
ncbi:hypothetical protein [Streptomyces sp. AS02]|uniref:hypothetical protein n=1 Tax=Streptomyces sp. AS02 TaxID=2938946 RepID=UPI002020285C|nr:hypothetical protein [Streptomyces sp. AS02]MCL8016956.1 hypothetical protein [Streptomyces sp. AS02]